MEYKVSADNELTDFEIQEVVNNERRTRII